MSDLFNNYFNSSNDSEDKLLEKMSKKVKEMKIEVMAETEYLQTNNKENHFLSIDITAPEQEKVNNNILVIIDRSGSMNGTKIENVKKSMEFFIEQLDNI